MPENLEDELASLTTQEETATQDHVEPAAAEEPQPEPEVGVEAKPEPRRVPVADLIELRHEKQALERQHNDLRNQVLQLQQFIMQQQQQAGQKGPELDPEIEKLLKPYLDPVRAQLDQAQRALAQNSEYMRFQQKWEYVQKNLPELKDLNNEFAELLSEMDEPERDAFLANERLIVKVGKSLAAQRKASSQVKVKALARASGKTESSSTPTSASADEVSSEVDFSKMSSQEFDAFVRERGFNL